MRCEYCGSEHDGSYGTGRFCSNKCSRAYSSSHRKHRLIIKHCKYCGVDVLSKNGISDDNVVCDACKKLHVKHKICKICGSNYIHRCENEFCKNHNIQQINTLIKYFGFNQNLLGTLDVEVEFERIRSLLYKDYWVDGLTTTQMAVKYGYPSPCNFVGKVFKYMNIPSRNCKDTSKILRFIAKRPENTHSQYKHTWYTTWDGYEVYLRSSYEIDFAKYLDSKKIHYEVESLRIKYWDSQINEFRCAIPDFYTPDDNTIYEVKSDYTYDKQNMDDRAKRYKELGYKIVMVLEHKEIIL